MRLLRRIASARQRAAVRAALSDICSEVLGRPVRPGDGFFDLGGTSLHAVMISGRAEERLGVPVPVRLVLESRSLADMAEHVADLLHGSAGGLPPGEGP